MTSMDHDDLDAVEDGVPVLQRHMTGDVVSRQSLIMRLVPQVVESRFPRVLSFRHSITKLRCSKESIDIQPLGQPVPSVCDNRKPTEKTQEAEDFSNEMANQGEPDTRPSSSRSSTLPGYQETETSSGINWRFALQGMNLISSAQQESSMLPGLAEGLFVRRLYVHGLTYLLRGLPNELTPDERMELKYALPGNVVGTLAVVPAEESSRPASSSSALEYPDGAPSVIHRILAATIVQFCILSHFVMPYIKLIVGHAYRLERSHRISERMFRASINTVNELGRAGIQVADSVCRMNDGKVGHAINEVIIWWIRGIAGGIHQGLDEGIDILGVPRPQPSPSRKAVASE